MNRQGFCTSLGYYFRFHPGGFLFYAGYTNFQSTL